MVHVEKKNYKDQKEVDYLTDELMNIAMNKLIRDVANNYFEDIKIKINIMNKQERGRLIDIQLDLFLK